MAEMTHEPGPEEVRASRQRLRQRQLKRRRRQRLVFLAVIGTVVAASSAYAFRSSGSAGSDAYSPLDTLVTVATSPDETYQPPAEAVQPPAETVPAAPAPSRAGSLAGVVICIDPGHALNSDPTMEPIGPGAAELKVRDPGGTSGAVSGVREPVVTLAIAIELKRLLEQEGATVVMTREGDTYHGGNRERAGVANRAGADLFIRIHCDGSGNPAIHGASTLYPELIPGWTDDIHAQSLQAAEAVQAALAGGLGVPDLGAVPRSDMTGFNWADVPAILVEAGFMSNAEEDLRLNDPAYQQQAARALSEGIKAYIRSR